MTYARLPERFPAQIDHLSEADGLTQEAIEADLVSALGRAGGAVPAAGKADLPESGKVGSVERRDMDL